LETRVEAAHIEFTGTPQAERPTSPKKKRGFEVGDAVLARYNNGAKLYRGTIKRVRSYGTYDVKYEGSDVETAVGFRFFDFVKEAKEMRRDAGADLMSANSEIMKLPKGLTRFEVLFRIHGRARTTERLTQEAYEFEESYRLENRGRWLRFFRLSILVFLILKPFMTMYMTIRLATQRSFVESHIIFVLNFCVMYPLRSAHHQAAAESAAHDDCPQGQGRPRDDNRRLLRQRHGALHRHGQLHGLLVQGLGHGARPVPQRHVHAL
jgi:hypothetical protein